MKRLIIKRGKKRFFVPKKRVLRGSYESMNPQQKICSNGKYIEFSSLDFGSSNKGNIMLCTHYMYVAANKNQRIRICKSIGLGLHTMNMFPLRAGRQYRLEMLKIETPMRIREHEKKTQVPE